MYIMGKQNLHEKFTDQLQHRLPHGEVEDFVAACRVPLKKSITINTKKISVEDFLILTKKRGRHLEASKFTDETHSFYIDREDLTLALGRTFLYQSGFFYIQEVAAALSATQLDLESDNIVLDMCAAPGGKTSQLANQLLTQEQPGLVVANDVNGQRLGSLAHNLNIMGRYNTLLTKFNGGSFGASLPNFFDHVLLDAPCSGEGTGYKSDYAMKYRNQAEINKICGTQLQLLISAIKTTKPGGTIVYSTCTLNPFENEGTLARAFDFFGESIELIDLHFQNLNEGINRSTEDRSFEEKEKVARCRPHLQKTGGFFIAKIRKLRDPKGLTIQKDHKLLPRNQFKIDQSKGLQKKVAKRMDENFGIPVDPTKHRFVATKEKVYLCSPTFKDISPQLNAEKMGIPIAKIDRYGYRPTHYLGNIFGHLADKHVVSFNDEQMQTYSEGKNIPLADLTLPKDVTLSSCLPAGKVSKGGKNMLNKYLIIQRNDYGMSVGKIVDGEVKNKFGK